MQKRCSNISRKESVIRYFGMDSFENIEQAKTTIQTFKNRYEEGSVFRWGIEKKGRAN